MTAWNRLFSYFPLIMFVASLTVAGVFAAWPSLWSAALLIFVLYLAPIMVQRIMFRWAPLQHGIACIDGRQFCSWLAAHHIQAFYDALPFLESLLRVFPGFYSLWLRMWGSRIGYGVEWPVRMDVLDRGLMDIGNRVVFRAKSNSPRMCARKWTATARASWCARCALVHTRLSAPPRISAPARSCLPTPTCRRQQWCASTKVLATRCGIRNGMKPSL
jgi:hypothetical protein